MELKNNKDQQELIKNIRTLDNYLTQGNEEAKSLIKHGRCFVVYQVDNELRFAPSRFIGYIDNTLEKHAANRTKDGRKTNPIISEILKTKPLQNNDLNVQYLEYCERLGITPDNTTKKFWGKILTI
jgi:5-methylcytosine-specific restriction protein A